jgi:cardiolipin synthase
MKKMAAAALSVALLLPTPATASTSSSQLFSVFTEPTAGFTPVYSLILSARRSLDVTMYELEDATAEHDLAAAAARGVNVRVFLDKAYSGAWANRQAASLLARAEVHVKWAPSSVIVHQKTIVVDDSTALIMTANLTSRYYSNTADFLVEDRRPADVAAIVRAFDDDWAGDLAGSTYQVPVRGQEGDLLFSPGSESALVDLIGSARSSLLTSSEEMGSRAVEDALAADARRGVNVQVLMTEDPSWDRAFRYLSEAGAHIRLYPNASSVLYIHAKFILVDTTEVYVGSINYSTSSMVYNRELGLITPSPAVVKPVAHAFELWWADAPVAYH